MTDGDGVIGVMDDVLPGAIFPMPDVGLESRGTRGAEEDDDEEG